MKVIAFTRGDLPEMLLITGKNPHRSTPYCKVVAELAEVGPPIVSAKWLATGREGADGWTGLTTKTDVAVDYIRS